MENMSFTAGRAMFGMLGIFAEFEREMLVACVNGGLARAKDALKRDGQFVSKAGPVRTSPRPAHDQPGDRSLALASLNHTCRDHVPTFP
jgi:DNA invertase Pin-like site-specific DNA recombinase